jgi:DNA-binding response OmpR family regulator
MADILIVEHEFIQATALEENVMALGHGVIGAATSVRHALAALNALTPDAALVDIDLDGEDPGLLVEELAARDVPVALVTSYGETSDGRFARHLALCKPVGGAVLEVALRALLRQRRRDDDMAGGSNAGGRTRQRRNARAAGVIAR